MEQYEDNLIKLNYSDEQDLLYAAWIENRPYSAAEVKKAFMIVVSSARDHKTRRILLNFADNTHNLTENDYKAVLGQLAVGLIPLAIRKIACVGTGGSIRKRRIMDAYQKISDAVPMSMQFNFFSSKAEALQWLLEE